MLSFISFLSCTKNDEQNNNSILGYDILNDLNGHWVGSNDTAFGFYDWFAFDFRPISESHCHSIYEGGTNQNIITSVFLAEYENEMKIMARNGGWLRNQYRATYYILDKAEKKQGENYYRLVDAVGGINRSYIEFTFTADSVYIDTYKDNSGSLDKPIHHMGFAGVNRNPSYSIEAKDYFNYPQQISKVNLNDKFNMLIDPDSALFLEESNDPFPKSAHGYLSDLSIDITRNIETQNHSLILYLSTEEIVSSDGNVNLSNLDNTVVRTISIRSDEGNYLTTYLHPDEYYVTIFSDIDNNEIPSVGDYSSRSVFKTIRNDLEESLQIEISLQIP